MRLVRFLKDWTLPVSIGLGIIIYFVFAGVRVVSAAESSYPAIVYVSHPLHRLLQG